MAEWRHGKTTADRPESSDTGEEGGGASHKRGGIEGGTSGVVTRGDEYDAGGNGGIDRSGAGDGGPVAGELSTVGKEIRRGSEISELGWPAQCVDDGGAGSRVSGPMAGASQGWGDACGVSFAGGVGGKTGQDGEGFGGVSIAGPPWMAQDSPRHASSQK